MSSQIFKTTGYTQLFTLSFENFYNDFMSLIGQNNGANCRNEWVRKIIISNAKTINNNLPVFKQLTKELLMRSEDYVFYKFLVILRDFFNSYNRSTSINNDGDETVKYILDIGFSCLKNILSKFQDYLINHIIYSTEKAYQEDKLGNVRGKKCALVDNNDNDENFEDDQVDYSEDTHLTSKLSINEQIIESTKQLLKSAIDCYYSFFPLGSKTLEDKMNFIIYEIDNFLFWKQFIKYSGSTFELKISPERFLAWRDILIELDRTDKVNVQLRQVGGCFEPVCLACQTRKCAVHTRPISDCEACHVNSCSGNPYFTHTSTVGGPVILVCPKCSSTPDFEEHDCTPCGMPRENNTNKCTKKTTRCLSCDEKIAGGCVGNGFKDIQGSSKRIPCGSRCGLPQTGKYGEVLKDKKTKQILTFKCNRNCNKKECDNLFLCDPCYKLRKGISCEGEIQLCSTGSCHDECFKSCRKCLFEKHLTNDKIGIYEVRHCDQLPSVEINGYSPLEISDLSFEQFPDSLKNKITTLNSEFRENHSIEDLRKCVQTVIFAKYPHEELLFKEAELWLLSENYTSDDASKLISLVNDKYYCHISDLVSDIGNNISKFLHYYNEDETKIICSILKHADDVYKKVNRIFKEVIEITGPKPVDLSNWKPSLSYNIDSVKRGEIPEEKKTELSTLSSVPATIKTDSVMDATEVALNFNTDVHEFEPTLPVSNFCEVSLPNKHNHRGCTIYCCHVVSEENNEHTHRGVLLTYVKVVPMDFVLTDPLSRFLSHEEILVSFPDIALDLTKYRFLLTYSLRFFSYHCFDTRRLCNCENSKYLHAHAGETICQGCSVGSCAGADGYTHYDEYKFDNANDVLFFTIKTPANCVVRLQTGEKLGDLCVTKKH